MRRGLKGTRAAVIGTALAVSMGLGACAAPAMPDTIRVENADSMDQITVSGADEVRAVPDMAEAELAVETQGADAKSCQDENTQKVNAVIEALKAMGIEEKSIQTSSYGMNPIKDWDSPNQQITGYEMTTRLTVSDIPLETLGEVSNAAVEAGANGIENVSYFCSTYDESYQEALKLAVEMAKTKAQALAEASGRGLGQVVTVEEFGYNPNQRYTAGAMAVAETAAAAEGASMDKKSMNVMAGEIRIEAEVQVTFSLE